MSMIDLSVVQRWVWDFVKESGTFPTIEQAVQRLGIRDLELHLRSRPDLFTIMGRNIYLLHMPQQGAMKPPAKPEKQNPINQKRKSGKGVTKPKDSEAYNCSTCGLHFSSASSFLDHTGSLQHRMKIKLLKMCDATPSADNANGIVVSELADFGEINVGQSLSKTLSITNTSKTSKTISSCKIVQETPDVTLSFAMSATGQGGLLLNAGQICDVTVTVASAHLGLIRKLVAIYVEGVVVPILRPVKALFVLKDGISADLKATAPFKPKPRPKKLHPSSKVIPGEPPVGKKAAFARKPGAHRVPYAILAAFEHGTLKNVEEQIQKEPTSLGDYEKKYHTLLFLEELQHEVDIRQYDMDEAMLKRDKGGKFFTLEVPGLAENRPSVQRGDRLLVRPADGSGGKKEWEGFVHEINLEEVKLCFHPEFYSKFSPSRKYALRFRVPRSTFVFQHEALSLVGAGKLDSRTLLPHCADPDAEVVVFKASRPAVNPAQIQWVNRDLNEEQRLAVCHVLRGGHSPLPHLIFGPPGTGKTTTLVEAIKQVLKTQPNSRLLLSAPSNSATDLLTQRLLTTFPASQVLRINAFQRPYADLPADLRAVSTYKDGAFVLPEKSEIMAADKRVVTCTCLMAAKLYAQGVNPGHFTHVFLDEAGQAEEPLSCCVLAGLSEPTTQVVLAGDPRQLGPIILSPLAKKYGLAMSLMERLIDTPPYKKEQSPQNGEAQLPQPDNSLYVTQLVKNYRSHPDILDPPNKMFYKSELQACADTSITHSLSMWDKLPRQGFPLLFHALRGKDEREASSPSWFNNDEVMQVSMYVDALLSYKPPSGAPLSAADIGIISPYRKQVQRIRRVLQKKAPTKEIKVGSVEEFQGQERRVILLSTVRSSDEFIAHDLHHKLGFLRNPKRLNVALTRAKALLIMVGNPDVLVQDPHWAQVLRFIRDRGGITGASMPEIPANPGASTIQDLEAILPGLMGALNIGSGDGGAESNGHQISSMAYEGGSAPRLD